MRLNLHKHQEITYEERDHQEVHQNQIFLLSAEVDLELQNENLLEREALEVVR
jgi:hypothetical protein